MIYIKPPLGLTPRFIVEERRIDEIKAAVTRYFDAGRKVPADWIAEYNELVERKGHEE
ncbi:hypothetical protein G5B47_02235 [Paenibacillus sp. 7124]|uniref:Uncharacterized protein n=1 Tax=Paenibacillus apii TaxID=1850370 RepID=A0A6M1PDG6_9BACL|nr:hypothetical protein [Paenibacillus apii]NGM81226.1 hypothetical protein [Paenibacillus apii]